MDSAKVQNDYDNTRKPQRVLSAVGHILERNTHGQQFIRRQIENNAQRPGTTLVKKRTKVMTQSQSAFPKFSLRTESKSQASNYFSLNNAVRQSAIKLDEHQQDAYLQARLLDQPQTKGEKASRTKILTGESGKTYCSSYSKGRSSAVLPGQFSSAEFSSMTPAAEMKFLQPTTDSQSEERRRQTTLFEKLRNQYGRVEIIGNKG